MALLLRRSLPLHASSTPVAKQGLSSVHLTHLGASGGVAVRPGPGWLGAWEPGSLAAWEAVWSVGLRSGRPRGQAVLWPSGRRAAPR